MEKLYDKTEIYDLFQTEEKYYAIKKHWQKILEGTGISSILDCSIGTGNLTLPLAELGIRLTGSDLSEAMLKVCQEKADKRGLEISLKQSDFRDLTKNFQEQFDCVASTGNSLPYVSNEELLSVLEEMNTLIKENGYLYLDIRNWDKILQEHNRFYLYEPQFKEDIRINLIQVWDYKEDKSMIFNLLYTFEKNNKIIYREIFEEHYFPIYQKKILDKLKEMHYTDIKLMCHPAYFEKVELEKVDWYCILAKKKNSKSGYKNMPSL